MPDQSNQVRESRAGSREATPRQATMADVAALSGVSVNTVSLSLREAPRVAPATQLRIRDAIDALGFTPNRLAGALAANQTKIIGVIIPTITYTSLSEIVTALTEVFDNNGYEILIGITNYSLKTEARIVETFLSYRPAGLVLTGLQHLTKVRDHLRDVDFPIVEILNIGPSAIDMCVGFDHGRAMRSLTSHFADSGRKRIAYARTPHLDASDRESERLSAFVAEMDAHSLPNHLVFESSSTTAAGISLMNQVLDKAPDTDAIIFSSHRPAIGSLIFCQQNGISIPGRFAIATFGAPADVAAAVNPGLASIEIDHEAIGLSAANAVLNRLLGEPAPEVPQMDIGFKFVRRGST